MLEERRLRPVYLPELISALRRSHPGDLVAIVGDEESIRPELETWCRFTGNPLLEATIESGRRRFVFRCGPAAVPVEASRPVGSRLWLLYEFRLQPSLRLLLRAFLAHRASTRTRASAYTADRLRSGGAWR